VVHVVCHLGVLDLFLFNITVDYCFLVLSDMLHKFDVKVFYNGMKTRYTVQ